MKVLTLRKMLESSAFPPKALERFLDSSFPTWAKYDPELGYRLNNVIIQDGMNNASSIYSYEPNGARRMVHYRDRPCRVNTYGNSFTQCHQVSDGETWQEVLAAHFGEPIRNFGVGGYGVYQAYRRMKRMESTLDGVPYVILNIYNDDHYRNIMACRWIHTTAFHPAAQDGVMFHNTPWVHVRLNLSTGKWTELDNPFNTPQSLHQLCEPTFIYETYRKDPVAQLETLCKGGQIEEDVPLQELANFFGMHLDFTTEESRRRTARELYTGYALRSTQFVIEQTKALLTSRKKKLMILLSYGEPNVRAAIKGQPRFDQELVDFLETTRLPFVDMLSQHVEDYHSFRIKPVDYCRRYYIGHYNPIGNQFFAFAIKNAIVNWLKPKPLTYAENKISIAEFAAKLA